MKWACVMDGFADGMEWEVAVAGKDLVRIEVREKLTRQRLVITGEMCEQIAQALLFAHEDLPANRKREMKRWLCRDEEDDQCK